MRECGQLSKVRRAREYAVIEYEGHEMIGNLIKAAQQTTLSEKFQFVGCRQHSICEIEICPHISV